jgi:hypothetical protein
MFRFQTVTVSGLSTMTNSLFIKDDGHLQLNQMMIINVVDDESKKFIEQLYFNITEVQTEKTLKGIKRGFAMIKIKRTKNPLAKPAIVKSEEENSVIDDTVDAEVSK